MDTNTAELLFALIVAAAIVGCVWARAWAKTASDRVYYTTKAARDDARSKLLVAKSEIKHRSEEVTR